VKRRLLQNGLTFLILTIGKPSIQEAKLSEFPGGDTVSAWTLTGRGGLSVTVLNYGGIVQRIIAPDARGELADLVLGFRDAADYTRDHPYFGATAGRIAGRVTKGELTLAGETFALPINDPPHHLHGGADSIDRRIWKAQPLDRADGAPSLRLTLISEDGDNAYPGRIELAVTYTVTDDNRFLYETEVRSDRPTPVSLTHHSYFNLSGESSGSTDDHELQILSDSAFNADERMGLTGECPGVAGHANDAREPKRVGGFVTGLWQEHGDLYWLGESELVRPVARLRDPRSGRTLEVATDCTCLQFYGGKGLDGTLVGKGGTLYASGAGVCLECEGYPNGFDEEKRFGSILVEPDNPQKTRTEYRFFHQDSPLTEP